MTAQVTGRPIQPSIAKQLGMFLALMDPRCWSEDHNRIAQGVTCPACGLDLWAYVNVLPREWPV